MHLVTIDDVPGGSLGVRLTGKRAGMIVHLARAAQRGTIETWLPRDMIGLLEAGEEGLDIARRIVERVQDGEIANGVLPANTRLLAPISSPRLIVAAGLAFKSHLAEMAGTPAPPHPTAFIKASSSVCGPGASLALPAQANEHVDYEGELACVFGRTCHAVSVDDALDYLCGYMAANDISARDWVKPVWTAKEPWQARLSWEVNIMGKQFAGFTALGPALVTTDEIPDPSRLQLTTRLNGKLMQQAPISDMIFPIAEMIAYFSQWYTFQPGDVLLSGTPAGVGVGRKPPVFLRPGDKIAIEIDAIGTLETIVSKANPSGAQRNE